MLSTSHRKAIVALISANIIWGMASPIFKLSLENIPPFTLAFIRFLGASFLLLPFVLPNLTISRKDWTALFFFSLFGITINISFFFLGLKLAPSINMPIIASSSPAFLYLLSLLFLKEKFHLKTFLGLLVSMCGVLLFLIQPLFEQGFALESIGNLFFLIAALGIVGHTIIGKPILNRYSAKTLTFWSFLIGAYSFFPLFLFEQVAFRPIPPLDYRGILGIIFGIFLSSTIAYTLYDWGIRKIPGQEIGIFAYIDPVVAATLAYPLLGETITPVFIVGSIFIFGGIFIAEGRLNYHPLHKLHS
ncbi:DMT family transporter [Candidatus Gottesmanbacteria bacterium]|nr:DMT family transporter [Candidatus Gottesmanbacteria bacterium]